MGLRSEIAEFEARLDAAIVHILELDVAEIIKNEMSVKLESYTYTMSRGPNGGGVRDKRNFKARTEQSGDTTILIVTDEAPFQTPNKSGKSLAEAVETGDPSFRMPGPRPFLEPTQEIMDSGLAQAAVEQGLRTRGFFVG